MKRLHELTSAVASAVRGLRSGTTAIAAAAVLLLCGAAAGPASAQTIAVRAGKLHTGTGQTIENGVVIIVDGRISAVGAGLAIPGDAELIEVPSGAITAGLIEANAIVESDDVRVDPTIRRAGGDLAPLWQRVDRSAMATRRLFAAEGGPTELMLPSDPSADPSSTYYSVPCPVCSGLASGLCPLSDRHGALLSEGLGCPVCTFPTMHGIMEHIMPGVRYNTTFTEASAEVVPHTRVLDAVNLRSKDFEWMLMGGVTTAFIAPDGAAVIGPMGAIVRTAGPIRSRVINSEAAVQATISSDTFRFGLNNQQPFGAFISKRTRRPTTRMGMAWVFRKAMYDTVRHAEGLPVFGADTAPAPALEALRPVLDGKRPLRILARDNNDIETALRFAEEFDLRFTLVEGTEAFDMIDQLKEKGIEVIAGPISDAPTGLRRRSGDKQRHRLTTIKSLFDAGFEPALSAIDLRDEDGLGRQAMYAIRAGLTFEQALRAVTVNPARILGIADEVGTIEPGKRADLVVWTGPAFEATSEPAVVISGGRVVHRSSVLSKNN
jgi:imidazolonepropionase-like amidohydrolase